MRLHLAQQTELVVTVEEHTPDNLCKDSLGSARDTCIVEQMTRGIFGLGEHVVRHPPDKRLLIESLLRL